MSSLTCRQCKATLNEKQLVSTTVRTDSCPHCQAMVHQQNAFEFTDAVAVAASDLAHLENWLASECEENRLTMSMVAIDQSKTHRWTIRGGLLNGHPDNWHIEVEFEPGRRDAFELRLTATENTRIDDNSLDRILRAVVDHGLQAHGARGVAFGVGVEEAITSTWGAVQHLGLYPLPVGLFRGRREASVIRHARRRGVEAAILTGGERWAS